MENKQPAIEENKTAVKVLESAPNVKGSTAEKTDLKQPGEVAESLEQINWRKFREAREVERKEKDAAIKRASEKEQEAAALKSAMEALLSKQQPVQQSQGQVIEEEMTEDQRIEKKVNAALQDKERAYEKAKIEREKAEFPNRLNTAFPDFGRICTEENLDYLDFHFPEVTAGYKHQPDSFEKWANIYKAVKRFLPNTESKKESAKAEKNFNKPQSMSVPGTTSVSDTAPAMLSDQRRQDNWARMQRVMKGTK